MPTFLSLARLAAVLLGASATLGSTAAQTVSNTATLRYSSGGAERSIASNTVTLDLVRAQRPTSISFHVQPEGYGLDDLACEPGPPLTSMAATVSEQELAASPVMAVLDVRRPVIILVDDAAADQDPTVRETVIVHADVSGHRQDIRLTETGTHTGHFAGGLPAIGDTGYPSPCSPVLGRGGSLSLHYDGTNGSAPTDASILVDPYGIVFDSRTGVPVDGATVTLLDENGRPATVFGEDGTSSYPSTVVSGAAVTDSSGRHYEGLTGHYHFPLVKPGRYTVQVTPPGQYHAPSDATQQALARLTAPDGNPFIINDASYGRPVEVRADADLNADIPLDPAAAAADVLVTKTASVREASPGDFVQYRVQAVNRGSAVARGLVLTDTLPTGLRYQKGSARGIAEPQVQPDGRTLSFALPALQGGAAADLTYVVSIAPNAPVGEAVNRARITGGGTSNEAAAAVRLHALLVTDALTLIGRVTQGACGDPPSHRQGVAGVRLLLEDGTTTLSDREGLYHFEGVRPGRHVVQIDTGSIGAAYRPVACDRDTRQAGSNVSRFVEGQGGTLKRVDFQLAPTGKKAAADALPVTVVDDATAAGDRRWLAGQKPGIAWLFPDENHNPRAPVIRVAIQHLPGQRVALTVNGVVSEPLAFDGTDTDTAAGLAVSRWSGLALKTGDNRLEVRVIGADGQAAATLTRTVHVSGPGVHADYVPAASRLVADGLTRPLVAVRVTDGAGRPVRAGTLVPFAVDAPYLAAQEADLAQARQLAGHERAALTARVVGDEGLAFLALQPTGQAGAAHLVVTLGEEHQVRTSEVRAWLAAPAKDWVIVGFGAGSLGFDTLRRHADPLPASGRLAPIVDGQLAFYAKGRVKGSWLLTVSYDSQRRYDPDRGLLGTIDPDRYYTVYGDGSAQGYDAPTQRKLYVRLERREAYALFGDFETGLTDAQLTRYSRTLNGVKAAYEGRHLRATGVVARTQQLYRRDEIQGNGLSGPYRLSARDIVPNSDKLSIEVRNRFRSEDVLSSRQLTRHIDYDIDAAGGTIRFREPVLSRDPALNPQFIVVDYEVDGGRQGQLVAAGRVAARLAGGKAEVGVGAVRDETAGKATVVGVDVKARPVAGVELRGEFATGGVGGLNVGRAWLAEAERHGGGLDILAYARQQDRGFGIGQQNLVEAGTRKLGIDMRLHLTDRLSLTATGWYQRQLDGPATRLAADLRLEWRRDRGTVFVGGQLADDTGTDGVARQSRLLTLGGTQALAGGKLELSGQTQIAPGGADSSVDFPVRQQVMAGWRVTPGIRLIAGYEIASGEDFTARTARVGFDIAPWHGAKLTSTINQQAVAENGLRTYAEYGLSQALPIDRHWTVDVTLDASSTLSGRIPTGAVINAFQPVASGGFLASGQGGRDNADFLATTLGASYRADRWSWTGRLERRDGGEGERWGITTSFLRALGEGRTLASSLKAYRLTDKTGATASSGQADLALAWRPVDSRWSVLERLQWRHERADAGLTGGAGVLDIAAVGTGTGNQVTTRFINNVAANYRTGPEGLSHGLEATFYYGAKYIEGRFGDDLYTGFIDVAGVDVRRDLGRHVDIGVQGSVQHAWSAGAVAWSAGPSVGLSPGGNLWVSAGYNIAGYRDRDFEADRYTRAGPYLTLRFKFDQFSLGGAARSLFGK